MNWILWGALALVLIGASVAGLAVWVRTLPVPGDLHARYEDRAPGDHPMTGGLAVARAVEDPRAALARLAEVAEDAPRTERFGGSVAAEHVSYVTRSRVFGFPDVTNLWIGADGTLQARAHLVYGAGDMGVNGRRLRGWLSAAGLDG